MTTGLKFIGLKVNTGQTVTANRFVKAAGTCMVQHCASNNDPALGISMNGGASEEPINIAPPGADALLVLGVGGASINDTLVSDANGGGVAFAGAEAGSIVWINAIALQAGNEGDTIAVAVRNAPIYSPATTTTTTTTEGPTTTTTTAS